jgi:glutamyl-tRNA(Gln) amidotransferase subunit D
MDEAAGYKGRALGFLKKAGAAVGDVIELQTRWGTVTGTLVPRYVYADPGHIVVKLSTGYNVGLSLSGLRGAVVKAKGEKPSFSAPPPPRPKKGLPRVLILGTGGTIASRVDYRTGAVHAAVSAGELHSLVPELSDVARVETEIILSVYSENVRPRDWTRIANRVKKAVREGFDGVVITHGTDTLGYTAAALSFALVGLPVPVLLVAAQRSSDRTSSDATLNLIACVSLAAGAPFSGVYVAMHLNENDEKVAVHMGTRVRKNHTSRRDAFASVGVPLAAVWGRGGIEHVSNGLPVRGGRAPFRARTRFDERVGILKFYPGMPGGLVGAFRRLRTKALIVEGTGLGHVNSEGVAQLKSYVRKGGQAFMTSQCINGRVNLHVYDTGRDLLQAGVIPLEDMLAETALVKAMWALGNAKSPEEVGGLMRENLAMEMTTRTFPR